MSVFARLTRSAKGPLQAAAAFTLCLGAALAASLALAAIGQTVA